MIGRFEHARGLTVNPRYAWALIITLVAAFISFFFSLQFGVFTLLFAAVAWWVWEYPEEGFLLFLVLMPILPMLKITQTIGTFSLIKDVIIITLFMRMFFIPLLAKKLEYRRNILWAPIVALVIWSTISALQADSLVLGILRLRDIVLYILLFFGVLYLRHDKKTLQQRLGWVLATFIVTLSLGAWQWFFAQDSAVLRFEPLTQNWIPRISGILAHPSIFGEYLITVQTLLVAIAVSVRSMKIRAGVLATVILSLIVTYATYSRGVWLGLAAALGVGGLLYLLHLAAGRLSRKKVASLATGFGVGGLLLGILLVTATPAGPLLRSIVDPTYGSNEERLEFLVRLIAPMTYAEAVFGRGLGDVLEQNFRETDLGVYDIATGASRSVQLTKDQTLVDNQYLKTFIEMGVVGLVLYGWLYWRVGSAAVRIARTQKPLIGLWAGAFLTAFLVQALIIDIWDIFPTNAIFWIVAAVTSQALLTAETDGIMSE
ncbi:MAG: O-antigen ligase family protein [Candidatus Andersenbacteria bacterium]